MRFFCLVVACALVACGSRDANVQHEAGLEFGNVSTGESHDLELKLTNTGKASAQLTIAVDSSDFTIDKPAITLPSGGTTALTVHFAPTALGPRTGTLSLGSSTVALSGRGIGPMLAVPSEVTLGPNAIVTGRELQPFGSRITMRNTGTSGSMLRLGKPRVEGSSELCLGSFTGSTCEPWELPSVLDTQTAFQGTLSILPSSPGPKHWTVTFPTNDPLNPEVTMEVRALVESFEPCVFSAPSQLVIANMGLLTIRHTGPGTCLVREITANPREDLRLGEPVPAPKRLERNSTLTIALAAQSTAPRSFTGVVRVIAEGTAPLEVLVLREPPSSRCLTVVPSVYDFGTVPMDCNSPTRDILIYNQCSEPVVIDSVVIASAAGEAAGGPNCPGSSSCPEFFMVSGISPRTTIPPGAPPLRLSVKYRPINYGPDTGAVVVTTGDGLDFVVALQGRGDMRGRNTDTYRQDALPVSDVLVMVDSSPSFVPRRPSVRDNLMPILQLMSRGCIDGRLAFAPADGAPGAGVRLQPNDAGNAWTSTGDPAFIDRALSAFDSLPVGSETEACIGPAADLIEDAGVRDGGSLAGICVTDALESTPNPNAALQRFMRQPSLSTWSAIASFGGPCGAEALDDGVHQSLVTAGNGIGEDICHAYWGERFLPIGLNTCDVRTSYYLTGQPAGAIEVRVDGVLSPSTNWSYDAVGNAVKFVPAFAPPRGATTTITYDSANCLP